MMLCRSVNSGLFSVLPQVYLCYSSCADGKLKFTLGGLSLLHVNEMNCIDPQGDFGPVGFVIANLWYL